MPRREIIAARSRGAAPRQVRDLDEACALANRIAPEHLELAVADPSMLSAADPSRRRDLPRPFTLRSARRLLRGPESRAADRAARRAFSSPLGVYDFQKRSSVLRSSPAAARARSRSRHARAGEGLQRSCAEARLLPRIRHECSVATRRSTSRCARARAARTCGRRSARSRRTRCAAGNLIKLDANESPFPSAGAVARKLAAAVADVPVHRYPDGGATSDRRAATALTRHDGLRLILGNGSDELIQMIALALARPGAVMLAPEPTFVMYRVSALIAAHAVRRVPLAGFRARHGGDGGAIARERPALIVSRVAEQPDGQPVRDRGYRADPAHRARGSSSSTRRTARIRTRASFHAARVSRTCW
jgi:hypothetical protein